MSPDRTASGCRVQLHQLSTLMALQDHRVQKAAATAVQPPQRTDRLQRSPRGPSKIARTSRTLTDGATRGREKVRLWSVHVIQSEGRRDYRATFHTGANWLTIAAF